MTVYRRLALIVLLLLVAGSVVLPLAARAASTGPNGLDRRVNVISAADLAREPASILVDRDRQVAAARLARWMLPGWLASILFQVVVLAYFWQSGAAARVRERLRSAFNSEHAVCFAFGATLVLIARVAALIPAFYLFRVGRVMGLSGMLLRTWAATWILNTVIAMIIAGLVVAIVLWLVDRTHQWYLYTMAAIVAGSFAITLLSPYISSPSFDQTKAIDPAIMASLQPLEDRAHLHPRIIVDERSSRTHIASAQVQGLGPTVEIVLSDTLISDSTLPELRFAVAHELGEIAANDPVRAALTNALLAILGVALAVSIADRIRFRRDDDPVSRLVLVAALLACVYVVVAPIDNAILRGMSSNADRYAVALTDDRTAAVRAVVRATDQRLDEICPSITTRLFLESWPPAGERIAMLNGAASGCP